MKWDKTRKVRLSQSSFFFFYCLSVGENTVSRWLNATIHWIILPEIGQKSAEIMQRLRFPVLGWSEKSAKTRMSSSLLQTSRVDTKRHQRETIVLTCVLITNAIKNLLVFSSSKGEELNKHARYGRNNGTIFFSGEFSRQWRRVKPFLFFIVCKSMGICLSILQERVWCQPCFPITTILTGKIVCYFCKVFSRNWPSKYVTRAPHLKRPITL